MTSEAERIAPETICGSPMPDRLWLHDMGAGDIEWSCEATPDGETPLESVEYIRRAILTAQGESK